MIQLESLRQTADEMLSGIHAGEELKRRVLFEAQAVEKLPQVADEMLSGLTKTPALRHRILVAYERRTRTGRRMEPVRVSHITFARMAPVMSMALVLILVIGMGAFGGLSSGGVTVNAPMAGISSYASGTAATDGVPEFVSLFAGESANPPLICINGRYYRMMTAPSAVSSALLDSPLAEVQTYTEEPSLASPAGIFSNVVKTGTPIYTIAGLSSKTAVAAEVDGAMRLFQRVSYAGSATLGTEMFQDTMNVVGQVAALELSGVGVITDEAVANDVLMYMLTEFATYAGADAADATQSLTIYLDNGLTLQLLVQDDVCYGCGAWSCPGFTESFRAEMAQ